MFRQYSLIFIYANASRIEIDAACKNIKFFIYLNRNKHAIEFLNRCINISILSNSIKPSLFSEDKI